MPPGAVAKRVATMFFVALGLSNLNLTDVGRFSAPRRPPATTLHSQSGFLSKSRHSDLVFPSENAISQKRVSFERGRGRQPFLLQTSAKNAGGPNPASRCPKSKLNVASGASFV